MSESGRLAGKRAIVTGAGSGIGRAIALAFADEDAAVLCADIDEATAMETAALVAAADGRALAEACDVSDVAATRRTLAKAEREFGGLDVLVNNAAFFATRMPLGVLDEALWMRTMEVNLSGAFLMSRHAIPLMARGGSGSIIHVASAHGHVANFGQAAYCASKGGTAHALQGHCGRPCKGPHPQQHPLPGRNSPPRAWPISTAATGSERRRNGERRCTC